MRLRASRGEEEIQQTWHPNYVQFYLQKDNDDRFPNLDELMLWLFHLVFREQQQECLERSLDVIAMQLRGTPASVTERRKITEQFAGNRCFPA